MKKLLISILMMAIVVALSYFIALFIAKRYGFEVYNVMTGISILIMMIGGLATIDETTIRLNDNTLANLNAMITAEQVGVKKQHELYFDSFKNVVHGYFGSKLMIILTGAIVFVVSAVISMVS